MSRVKLAVVAGALCGVTLAISLIVWFGAGAVLKAFATLGWSGLALLLVVHLLPIALCGAAWQAATAPKWRRSLAVTAASRMLRDAGSDVLPVSAAGGAVIGARGMMLAGMPGAVAFASTVVDMTLELVAQLVYTAGGIALLIAGARAPRLDAVGVAGLLLGIAATAGFILAQRLGLFRMLERLSERFLRNNPALSASEAGVHAAIHALYRRTRGVALGILWHALGWCATAFESWVALRLIHAPLPFSAVFMIESLILALKSATFFVPSGWGIQEGGYVLLGALVGLPAGSALALSLVKRARDLAVGAPVLIAWQAIEARLVRRALT